MTETTTEKAPEKAPAVTTPKDPATMTVDEIKAELLPAWRELLPAFRNVCDALKTFTEKCNYLCSGSPTIVEWDKHLPHALRIGSKLTLTLDDAAPESDGAESTTTE